jgi:hypothetical protein
MSGARFSLMRGLTRFGGGGGGHIALNYHMKLENTRQEMLVTSYLKVGEPCGAHVCAWLTESLYVYAQTLSQPSADVSSTWGPTVRQKLNVQHKQS